MLKSKKGSGRKPIEMIIEMFFTIFVIVFIVVMVNLGLNFNQIDRSLDARIIGPNILQSKSLNVNDPYTGRVYFGWIDDQRFNSSNVETTSKLLEQEFKTYGEVNYISMNITLIYFESGEEKSVYFNKENYIKGKTFVEAKLTKGSAGYNSYIFISPVAIGKNKEPGYLNIEMIFPN
jgi:hypothetical protein